MADYWVDDGGDGTAGTSWATAYQSIAALVAAVPAALTTSGNRIFIGDDHNDSVTGADRTFTGPASGLPVLLISCDRTSGTSPPAYKVGTGDQLRSSDGAFYMVLDGSFSLYGIRAEVGGAIGIQIDTNETGIFENATLAPGANGVTTLGGSEGLLFCKNFTLDFTADGTTNRSAIPLVCTGTNVEIDGLTFVNAAYKTGSVFNMSARTVSVSGADFSGFTNATLCEIVGGGFNFVINNCLTAATWAPASGVSTAYGSLWQFYNVGPADAPTYLYVQKAQGTIASSDSIYRTGGATVEGDATGWLITTTAICAEAFPLTTPWIYGLVSSTGSKTFDVYITNDTADFDDSQVWLEVEYLGTADEAQWTLAKDQRATITTTAAAQTDDVTSTWNGAGPAFTYMQKLSVTATVNETGQYRARVCVGVASIAGSRYFYIDPKVTVT
jgi:hypothetical protein